MIRSFVILMCGLALYSSSCASLRETAESELFKKVGSVTPGITTREELTKLFGPADLVHSLEDTPVLSDDGDLWIYKRDKASRFNFYFRKNAPIVSGVTWTVRTSDDESDLSVAKAWVKNRFQISELRERDGEDLPANSYTGAAFTHYEAPEKGVAISLNKSDSTVSTISWTEPSVFAEFEHKRNHPPKTFCFGPDDEDRILSSPK